MPDGGACYAVNAISSWRNPASVLRPPPNMQRHLIVKKQGTHRIKIQGLESSNTPARDLTLIISKSLRNLDWKSFRQVDC